MCTTQEASSKSVESYEGWTPESWARAWDAAVAAAGQVQRERRRLGRPRKDVRDPKLRRRIVDLITAEAEAQEAVTALHALACRALRAGVVLDAPVKSGRRAA